MPISKRRNADSESLDSSCSLRISIFVIPSTFDFRHSPFGMHLCLIDLANLTGGRLQLAAMPPLDGVLARFGRIVLSPDQIAEGDVFWQVTARPGDIETAFFRGAFGVVVSGRSIEPWPGRFCLHVNDPITALGLLINGLQSIEEQFSRERSDLKDLQLCAARPIDISPPTCGRSADGERFRRCRRQAA